MPEADPSAVEALLADARPDLAELARLLRARFLDVRPDLEERVYRGWRGLGYHARGTGYVCAIFLFDDHIDVGFEHGADLADPHRLFYRGGKQIRYVRLEAWEADIVGGILELIDSAIAWQSR